jgi:hypothetical protein
MELTHTDTAKDQLSQRLIKQCKLLVVTSLKHYIVINYLINCNGTRENLCNILFHCRGCNCMDKCTVFAEPNQVPR